MKILKAVTHSFIPQPIELGGKLWLSAGVLLYFDLTAPESLLKEQELWQEVPPLLGEVSLLDQGWPKPSGEFLVAGACCAPADGVIQGARVGVRVGNVQKELAVFGDRRWTINGFGGMAISAPVPFSEMPVAWSLAFGGNGFQHNPAGVGFIESGPLEGIPLPNVEDPARLVVLPGDRPSPAGFGLVPAHYPQRAKLSGTYDDRWKRERWPGFPEDIDPRFFLASPDGQRMPGYFTGSETIEIRNMHHEFPVIVSRLPKRRVRLFFLKRPAGQKQGYRRQELLDGEFFEAKLNPETLWLFPGILRGVLLYRALVPCRDDEYSDYAWAHIADEEPSSEPLSLEHYRDYVLEKADFGQSVIAEKMQELQRELGKGAIAVRNLPKQFKAMKAEIDGRAPQMQTTFPDLEAAFRKGICGQREMINEIAAGMKQLHESFGHMVPVGFDTLDNARTTINGFETMLDEAAGTFSEAGPKSGDILRKAGETLKQQFLADVFREKGIDPLNLAMSRGRSPFHDKWFPFVVRCRMMLMADIPVMTRLKELGLAQDVATCNWLGWNEHPVEFQLDGEVLKVSIHLPRGLVVPRFAGARLAGFSVRPEPLTEPGFAVPIPGSEDLPRFLEAAAPGGPVVILPDELAAFLIEKEAGDFADITVMSAPSAKLADEALDRINAGAPTVLLLPDATEAALLEAWEKVLPGVGFVLLHKVKDVFEARKNGIDLREEIIRLLPDAMARQHRMIVPEIAGADLLGTSIEEAMGEQAITAAIENGFREMQTAWDAKMAPMLKMAEEKMAIAREEAAKPRTPLPDPPKTPSPADVDISLLMARQADKLDAQRKELLSKGLLPSDKAEAMAKVSSQMREQGIVWQKQKMQLDAMEPPEEMKAAFAKHGIDVADLKAVTRENLQQRLDAGRPFKMCSFRKLDLSGIDFSGRDLTMANFDSCDMRGCRFDRAILEGAMIGKCDLREADLGGAVLDRTMFTKCDMAGMRCIDTRVHMVSLDGCDLTGADFSGSTLKLFNCRKGVLKNAIFERARIELAMVAETDFTGARLGGAYFFKTMLEKCSVDGLLFPGVETDALLLHGCKGEKVRFENSKLFKLRIGEKSELPGLAISGSMIEQGYFRNANLKGASFSTSTFKASIFDGCDLTGADFRRVPLFQCQFPKSDLEGADLSKSNIFMGSLRKARVVGANLQGANLYGVDFRKCVMGGTKMGNVNLKRSLIEGREQELRDGGYIR